MCLFWAQFICADGPLVSRSRGCCTNAAILYNAFQLHSETEGFSGAEPTAICPNSLDVLDKQTRLRLRWAEYLERTVTMRNKEVIQKSRR